MKKIIAELLYRVVGLVGAIFLPITNAEALTSTEQQLQQYIVAHQTEALQLLEQLVNINSGTMNFNGVRAVGNILQEQFQQIGFATHWISMPKELHREGTLIAQRQGRQGKRILLIGHLDTVFASDSSFQQFKRQDNIATGPGVIDMKGGDVVILYALKALAAAQALDDRSITVVLTGDEENTGKPTSLSRKAFLALAKDCDIALDFEWALAFDTATIARRGVSNWILHVQGQEAHSSKLFESSVGAGAILELARIINTWRLQLAAQKGAEFNPGLTMGGTSMQYNPEQFQGKVVGKPHVVAPTALAIGDIRFLSDTQQQTMKQIMQHSLQQPLAKTNATLVFQDAMPAMTATSGNRHLLAQYSQASIDLSYGPVRALKPETRGAGDISFVANTIPANLAGLGPVGTGAHSVQETLDIKSLPIATQRAAILIYRLTHS